MKKYNWFERNVLGLKELPKELTQNENIDNKYYEVKRKIYDLLNSGVSSLEKEQFFKILKKIDKIQEDANQR